MSNKLAAPTLVMKRQHSPVLIRLLLAALLAATLGPSSTAQDSSSAQEQQTQNPPPAAPQPQTKSSEPGATKSEAEKQIERKEQSERVLGVVPIFSVTNRQNASPLTSREKFRLFYRQSFDPVTLGVVGFQAALSQAENEFPAYGQGAAGYGKRYGASLADEVSSGFWANYFYPVLLKEDPRYFRLGEGGFRHRFLYSVEQEVIVHKDKGGKTFNFSNVLGAFTTGAVSNLYYPGRAVIRTIPATATTPAMPVYEDDRGVVLTLSRASIALGYGVVGGLFNEFWPDLHDKLSHRHKKPTEPGADH